MCTYLCYFSGQNLLCKKCGVPFTFQMLNLSSVETLKCRANLSNTIIYLLHQTHTCSLATIGRFKFMDNNAILIKLFFNVGGMVY